MGKQRVYFCGRYEVIGKLKSHSKVQVTNFEIHEILWTLGNFPLLNVWKLRSWAWESTGFVFVREGCRSSRIRVSALILKSWTLKIVFVSISFCFVRKDLGPSRIRVSALILHVFKNNKKCNFLHGGSRFFLSKKL